MLTKELFPSFSEGLVEEIEQNATIFSYKGGDILMRTGQYVKSTMLLINGKIKVYREGEDGGEFFMYYLHPGQACALSMICATRNQTSEVLAKAVEDSEVMMVPLKQMDQWMMVHRSWYEFVIETYRTRFEEVLTVLDSVAFRAMDERLSFYLNRQREALGTNIVNLSHQDIATDLNTSREVISRLLKKMEQRGMVKLFRNHLEILD